MKYIFLSIFIFIYVSVYADSPILNKKTEKIITNHFLLNNILLEEIEKLKTSNDLYIKVTDNNKEIGFAVLSSAKGRVDSFEFIIIYNSNLEIEYIKILSYKSQYGSEITSKNWLKQFYRKMNGEFNYGSDIQAISGATYSATSLTKSINRISKQLKEYNKH